MAYIKYRNIIEYRDVNPYSEADINAYHGLQYSDEDGYFSFIVCDGENEYMYPTTLTIPDNDEHFIEYRYDIPNRTVSIRIDRGLWHSSSIPELPLNFITARLTHNAIPSEISECIPVAITVQPENIDIDPGGEGELSIQTSGSPPIEYEWEELISEEWVIVGNTRILTVDHEGLFRCLVYNLCGDELSQEVTVTIQEP